MESRRSVHTGPQQSSRVRKHNSNFGGASIGIENTRDVADFSSKNTIRKCVQTDVCWISDADGGKIVLIDVAEHPDFRKVSDGKQVGRIIQALDALKSGNILLDDSS